ncbi:V-type ATP synthase subunit F [Treponema sp. C6A8]|uniref:V-type ATP synthase subunit F n=1 Tax=Treponema sp. C6A8 TaxID=1410609 RepID=UPI000482861B|nr:V-type ATP synthase subunit F [Treponema sp. C6A8]
MKFYIIGERELVLAFKLTGVDGTIAENRNDVLNAFNRITGKGGTANIPTGEVPKVLILTEGAASQIEEEELAWQKTGNFPLIVEIPGLNGHVKGRKMLSDAIKQAVGVEV